jgi:hypothetical protein
MVRCQSLFKGIIEVLAPQIEKSSFFTFAFDELVAAYGKRPT